MAWVMQSLTTFVHGNCIDAASTPVAARVWIMAVIPSTQRGGQQTSGGLSAFQIATSVAREVWAGWRQRDHGAVLTFIAVPLAMISFGLTGLWWTWLPLAAIAGAAMLPTWWESAAWALQEGYVGTAWAYVGTRCLGDTGGQIVIAVVWGAFPCAMAIAGQVAKTRRPR
jgi:hypothetical protein